MLKKSCDEKCCLEKALRLRVENVFSNEEVTQNQGYVATVGQLKDEYQTKEFVTSVSVIPEVPLTRAAAPSATAKVLRSG